jgi:[ribosomal protein S5]-alanine N-acetyltransferase
MEIRIGEYKLRKWNYGDEDDLVKYASNHKIWINLDDAFPFPYTRSNARDWIGSNFGRPLTNFAITSETEVIGGAGFKLMEGIFRSTAEIGYWLGEPFWGKGIITSAVGGLVQYAFANFDLVRLQAIVFEWNTASMRVLEKNGFKQECRLSKSVTKDGKIIDSFLYALTR